MICSLRQHGMAVKALLILNGTEEGGTYMDTTVNLTIAIRVPTPDHVKRTEHGLY